MKLQTHNAPTLCSDVCFLVITVKLRGFFFSNNIYALSFIVLVQGEL